LRNFRRVSCQIFQYISYAEMHTRLHCTEGTTGKVARLQYNTLGSGYGLYRRGDEL
jgi:hypothetical protein